MKTTKRIYLTALMAVLSTVTLYAQTYEWEKAPKQGERIIENINTHLFAGSLFEMRAGVEGTFSENGKRRLDKRTTKTKEECYATILSYATLNFSNRYPNFELRNVFSRMEESIDPQETQIRTDRDYKIVATVVVRDEPQSSPKEKSQEDEGKDDTALNHLVVHFDVISRPQGADVEWRVISKTPEVKNTNYKYLQTTPYESTETLTINGLTFNNSGLVQIEIKVSKNGYYPQTKKYNVRSVIDEKEVSGIYRLVKEE